MKNLIFFLPSFSNYGAGNSTLRLCKILDKKNQYKGLFDQLLDIAIHDNSSKDEEKPIIWL